MSCLNLPIMPFSHQSEHTKLMASLIIILQLEISFYQQLVENAIDLTNLKLTVILPAGWQQRLFLSAPSPACFIGLILLRSLLFDFPCANLDTPIALGRLVLNVLCVGRVVRPPGTAAIYRSGQTNIGSHWAVCGPLPLP